MGFFVYAANPEDTSIEASYNTRPNEYDPEAVTVSRIEHVGQGQHEAATPRSETDRPTRALPGSSEENRPTRAHYIRAFSSRDERAQLSRHGMGQESQWVETGTIDRLAQMEWLTDLARKRFGQ
jgi:hypothetical protein